MQDFKRTVEVFHQRRAAFHPVTAVQVMQALDLPAFRPVDVAADDPVGPGLGRHLRHPLLKLRHVADRGLGLEFQPG